MPELTDRALVPAKYLRVLAFLTIAGSVATVAQAQQAPAPATSGPPPGAVGGIGDVNLFPKRVVIDGRQRVVSVGLYNKSTNPGDYDISITDKMMTEDGQLVDLESVTDPAARARVKTASQLLRWSPHMVMLRGSEAQTVRIMARITPDLAPGEYRSHFLVIAVPPNTEGGVSIADAAGTSRPDSLGVRIVPRFGISIPVIVRVGQTTLTTALKDIRLVSLPAGGRAIAFTITRDGTRSAFGDIVVTAAGVKKPLAELKGIGVYTEIDARKVQVLLDPAVAATALRSGAKLTVTYTDDDFTPGQILARQEFVVP